jgi:hypothetical protein
VVESQPREGDNDEDDEYVEAIHCFALVSSIRITSLRATW